MFVRDGVQYTVVAVVAAARNGIIGREGDMPWRLPSDLKRYRALTMGRPMVMGRKTLASIGRVLDGRDTIVLTRGGGAPFEGAHVAGDAQEALRAAAACAARRGSNEIVIAGGGEVYRVFLPFMDRIEMTRVAAEPEGDTSFPELAPQEWETVADVQMARTDRDGADARFLTLVRKGALPTAVGMVSR